MMVFYLWKKFCFSVTRALTGAGLKNKNLCDKHSADCLLSRPKSFQNLPIAPYFKALVSLKQSL